jgi:hypothetical protein
MQHDPELSKTEYQDQPRAKEPKHLLNLDMNEVIFDVEISQLAG